ncbi:hypothetical protein C3K47_17275 [Solitalea longa]|uniref:Uncharacterized protein n=1 Tax=Solitalea longa TaxID=2079460 RepID=A0A2S4ZY86_9SPHI|nr:hypothetical protein C3K47_17275 [Solitalea longa]
MEAPGVITIFNGNLGEQRGYFFIADYHFSCKIKAASIKKAAFSGAAPINQLINETSVFQLLFT